MSRNKGFTIVEVVIVLAIVAIIGLIGWRLWDANQSSAEETAENSTSQSQTPDVKTDADLDKAESALDAVNVEGDESQQLDAQTNF